MQTQHCRVCGGKEKKQNNSLAEVPLSGQRLWVVLLHEVVLMVGV